MSEFTKAPTLDLAQGPVEVTRDLCNIASVSGEEATLADAIERALHEQAPHLTIVRDGDTIVARTELGRSQRVIIAGHLDTVPVNGNLPTWEAPDPKTGEMLMWGRGTVDMKAGVALQLVLAAELADPAVDVTWVWYDHEEVDSSLSGLGRVLRNRPELFDAAFAILGEPTNGAIEGGCNGTLRVRVTFRGKQAHSARGWMGINAIHRAGTVLRELDEFVAERIMVDGLEYRESLNAVGIEGGVAGNVVPDVCTVIVNYRFAPSRSIDEAIDYVRTFFAEADEIEVVDRAAGALPGMSNPLVQAFTDAVGATVTAKLGWTDVARFAGIGIPAVNFGPGNPLLAHADDERVSPDEIVRATQALRAWLDGSEGPLVTDKEIADATARLWIAVETHDTDGVRRAIAEGADLTSVNRNGGVALIPASERGLHDMIEVLLATGIDVNHVNSFGWTALHEAIVLGDGSTRYIETVRLLLAGGANPNIPDSQGMSPRVLAEERGYRDIVALIDAAMKQ